MTPALVISPQKTRGKMKWTLMNTPFAEMLYSVARTSEHLFPQHSQLGPWWSNRVCIVKTFSIVPTAGHHHLNHMRIKQGTIVSMINLHLVIGNNNTCCGVVVVGRLMAQSFHVTPIIHPHSHRSWECWEAANEKQVNQFYPSQKHFIHPIS